MRTKVSSGNFDFDHLYEQIACKHFAALDQSDDRRDNRSISMSDACKTGFAVYCLKAASLLDFRPKAPCEEVNLKNCFSISKIPSDSGLRKLLDRLDSTQLRGVFKLVWDFLKTSGVLEVYHNKLQYLSVSIDGVHHYSSKKIACPCCLKKNIVMAA